MAVKGGVLTDLDPASYAEPAARWGADGASIVGGCCETASAHVRALVERLR